MHFYCNYLKLLTCSQLFGQKSEFSSPKIQKISKFSPSPSHRKNLTLFTRAAGAHLSANLSYLLYLIKMGDSFLEEAAAQITSLINQERISCALGEQLAEDHLAHLSTLLLDARAHLTTGMERAVFAAPGKRAVMHQQVGNHVIYVMSPLDGKDVIMLNRLKCKHSSKLVDCRVDHKNYLQEASLAVSTLKSALKTSANKDQPAKSVAIEETSMSAADIRRTLMH